MRLGSVVLLCVLVFLVGCGQTADTANETNGLNDDPIKPFTNVHLRKIYDLQNNRDTDGLLAYLKEKDWRQRAAAALALASVQDKKAVPALVEQLRVPSQNVRFASYYALGQIGDTTAEPALIDAYANETETENMHILLEALGKCGTEKALTFLSELQINPKDEAKLNGAAYGLYRLALRNITSEAGTEKTVTLLAPEYPKTTRLIAAHYLMRSRDLKLEKFADQLIETVKNETNVHVRMAVVGGMGNAVTPKVLETLKSLLTPETDYRIKINALRAFGKFDYKDVKDAVMTQLTDKSANVSIAAAEFLLTKGNKDDARLYFDTAKQLTQWRSRATLLETALKLAGGDQPDKKLQKHLKDYINAAYKKTNHSYEKGHLLRTLGQGDRDDVTFLETQAFANVGNIVGTSGMTALMTLSEKNEGNNTDTVRFGEIFKKAIATGDSTFIYIGATALRNKKSAFKETLTDHAFLSDALNRCKLPEDIEAWVELKKTIAFFEGKEYDGKNPLKNKTADWDQVNAVFDCGEITVKTTKGDITIGFFPAVAPGSVVNFVDLIKAGFYKDNVFHRVAPNFVIQAGCPRGDGTGGPAHTIGSELGPLNYDEGFVGMASAGKDTEGSQWFITHSPTPHLDGRYTIFGMVTKGMDVVHQIEVGDRILGFSGLEKLTWPTVENDKNGIKKTE